MQIPRRLLRASIVLSFVGVAALQAWPLPLHLSDRLTGNPGGDTGVYVWNTWVFRHELIDRRTSPFQTDSILPLPGPADLSLHNYTVFADVVALPLQPWLGVVASFNVVYLINVALAGLGMILLARRFRGAVAVGTAEAWLAGLLFACSPFLVARSTAHFSLAAAAPLPFFVLCFDRLWSERRVRDAVLTGASMAWAAFSDPYYAIYCVILGLIVMAGRTLTVVSSGRTTSPPPITRAIDIVMVAVAAIVGGLHLSGYSTVHVGGVSVSVRSLYTPMLLLTTLASIRVWLTLRPRVDWTVPASPGRLLGMGLLAASIAAVLMGPELYAMAMRVAEGRMVTAPVLWRSSAPGLDLLAFLVPNPNHPLAPSAIVEWISSEPGHFEENVASIPWVALIVIAVAWRRAGSGAFRFWAAVAIGTASLALGPFLRVAGVETYVPTPWAFLRYVPLIGEARMPPRFAVIVVMAVAMLFATALTVLGRRYPTPQRRRLLAVVGILLAFELLPAPRELYSAEIPSIYDIVARDPRQVRLLELPFGIRDGLSSLGDFSASSQFFQTRHGKALIGGYLSRVSQPRKEFYLQHPYVLALIRKSEGHALSTRERDAAAAAAADFVRSAQLGYVVIDTGRVTPALQQFAVDTLKLRQVGEDGFRRLYVPGLADQTPDR